MLQTIEKLLILQDRDRKLHRVHDELAHVGPERDSLISKASTTQAQLDAAKTRVKQIESERKRLELDIESKKSQIEKYANQQLQTRKNEEYKALRLDGRLLDIVLPQQIPLKVVDTVPPARGDLGSSWKEAKLETGLTIMVPLFIANGEIIRVDTAEKKYLGRETGGE